MQETHVLPTSPRELVLNGNFGDVTEVAEPGEKASFTLQKFVMQTKEEAHEIKTANPFSYFFDDEKIHIDEDTVASGILFLTVFPNQFQ